MKKHLISKVFPNSIASEMDIVVGDHLVAINDAEILDIFDYQYYTADEYLELTIEKANGEQWILEIEKDYDEDIGIEFDNGLMDDYKSCYNKCVFCFIDQMPPGMRETLYFKDDDSRLSFLQGNYVTLTNMSDDDIERIIKYNMSPINISFQTTNPELRCEMLHNRFAGEALKKVDRLYEAGITMNGQIVLCKDLNDKEELERTISDLSKYLPYLESVSVVPVGLTKYRDGLYELKPLEKEDAINTIDIIEKWQKKLYPQYGLHFIHASDEIYLLAEKDMPEEDRYDGYLQLENGVGMLRLLMNEFDEAYNSAIIQNEEGHLEVTKRSVSIATGRLAYPVISKLADTLMQGFTDIEVNVYAIRNDFFGEMITVSGLITGVDLINQLKNQKLGEVLYLPENILRSGEDVFLDDLTVGDLESALQVKIDIVKSDGWSFVSKILGEVINE